MKKITLFILALSCYSFLFSQEVVSSSGATHIAGDYELNWTLGEPAIESYTAGTNILTQGFHQTKLVITALNDLAVSNFDLKVYPNPTSDFVNIHLKNSEEQIQFALYDITGRKLYQRKVTETDTQVEMANFANGTYVLKLFVEDYRTIQIFKIIKR